MDEKKNITPVLSDETDAASVPDAGELRRKKKRQRQLVTSILLVVFAAVLIAVYFIVAPLLSEDGNAADTTETEAVSVSAHQSSEVLSLTFPSSEESEGTITLSRGSSSADWEYVQRPGFPLSDTKLSKLASAVASISASREITEPESLSTYGLDNPSLTVTVGYSDGTTRSYSIGNYNEFSSVYYMMTDGSNTIYTVDSTIMRTFTVSEDDLISLAALPTDITYTGYSVTAPDGSADNYTGDMLTDSYTELLGKLELTGWAAYAPSDEQLSEMGLGDDAYTVTVSYSKEVKLDETNEDSSATSVKTTGSYSLRVGGKVLSEDGSDTTSQRYLLYGDDGVVYKADSSVLDALISGTAPAEETTAAESKMLTKCGSCGKARIQQNRTKHRGGSR